MTLTSSKPSIAQGLRRVALDAKETYMTLTWKPNPATEKIDKYAVYGFGPGYHIDGHGPGDLLGVTSALSLKIPIQPFGDYDSGKPYPIQQGSGYGSYFWVMAHNTSGWGKNDVNTP